MSSSRGRVLGFVVAVVTAAVAVTLGVALGLADGFSSPTFSSTAITQDSSSGLRHPDTAA